MRKKTSVDMVHGIVLDRSTVQPYISANAGAEKVIMNCVTVGVTDHIIDNIQIFSKYFSGDEFGLLLLGSGITDAALERLQVVEAPVVVETLSGNEEIQNKIRDEVARFTGAYVIEGRSFVEKDVCYSAFQEGHCLGGGNFVTVITSRRTYIMLGLGEIYGTCGQLESIKNILLVQLGGDVESDASNLTEIMENKYPE